MSMALRTQEAELSPSMGPGVQNSPQSVGLVYTAPPTQPQGPATPRIFYPLQPHWFSLLFLGQLHYSSCHAQWLPLSRGCSLGCPRWQVAWEQLMAPPAVKLPIL